MQLNECIPVYRWNGRYWGFIYKDNLFDKAGRYYGWVDDNKKVWRKDGHYFGEILDNNYIMKKQIEISPIPKVPKIPPIPPIPPMPFIDKVSRIPKVGWIDPLP